jgi:hypothetical protein
MVLPIGAICDACNHYLGHELDDVLVAHPLVSFFVQFLGLNGKSGKPRKVLGNVSRNIHPNSVTIPTEAPVFRTEADGSRTATVRPVVARNFSLSRFRRALHHIGLNVLALQDGAERALEAAFDPVRRYVRSPHKGERWPYAQYLNIENGLARDVTLVLEREADAEFVGIVIAKSIIFGVDLLNTGRLEAWMTRELPKGSHIVAATDDVPREGARNDGKSFRITLDVDG